MQFGFSYIGLIWLAMLFIPNFIWTKNKPEGYDGYASKESRILLAFERTGQFIVTPTVLMFRDFNFKGFNFWLAVLGLSLLCMVLYDIAWARYFRSSKTMKDFYRSFLGMPLCLATYPVIAFFLLGIYGGNILMIIGAVILGIGHIGIHAGHAREVFGPRKKRHIVIRIFKWIGAAVLTFIFGVISLCIAGRNINQIKRAIICRNGVNEQTYIQLNDQEEYVVLYGTDNNNPVIISLHGGPGAPVTFSDVGWQDNLIDEYTVVAWDERGCGRTYYHNDDEENTTLSFEQQIADLDALVDYCRERFDQDRVIILGHSYGSFLGSQYVIQHPEKVSAYIGVGQFVNAGASLKTCYEDALAAAKAQGDDTTYMELAYEAYVEDPSYYNYNIAFKYCNGYHRSMNSTAVLLQAFESPYLASDDLRWFLKDSDMEVFDSLSGDLIDTCQTIDIREQKNYQVPVYFISGTDDWSCSYLTMTEYAESLGAGYLLIEGAGHYVQADDPHEFAKAVKDFLKTV